MILSTIIALLGGALAALAVIQYRRAIKRAYEDGYRVGLHRGAEILSANVPGLQARLGDLTKVKR